MSRVLQESFNGVDAYADFVNNVYNDSDANCGKWRATLGGSTDYSIEAGTGPRGDRCLRKLTNSSACVKSRTIPGALTEVIFGFRFKPGTLGASADGFIALYDQAGTVIFRLNHTSATIQVQYGTSSSISTQLTTGSVLSLLRWDYIEVRYKMADSGGATEVRINGAVVFSSTADNKLTASTSIAAVAFGVNGQSATGAIDDRFADFYINSAAGSAHNSFEGDTKVYARRPNGNGSSSDAVGSDGNSVDNYQLVDEATRNPADYVETTADGDRDTYQFEPVVASGVIQAVQFVVQAAALNVSDPKDFSGIAIEGADELTALLNLDTVMREQWCIFEQQPPSDTWVPADLSGAEFGFEQIDA